MKSNINELIKIWKYKRQQVFQYITDNKETLDKHLATICFAVSFSLDKYILHPIKKMRIFGTKFSKKNDEELISQFSKEHFTEFSKNEYEHLFQEVYNRQTENAGCTPKYIVNVGKNRIGTEDALGYLETASNKLHINIDFIKTRSFGMVDKDTIGAMAFNVITHETQHNIQNEKIVRYLLNEPQSEYDDALSAMNILTLSMMYLSAISKDPKFQEKVHNAYAFDMNEHDANMKALKESNKIIDKKNKNYENFIKVNSIFGCYTLRMDHEDLFKKDLINEIVEKRPELMRENVIEMLTHFDTLVSDCDLKRRITKTIEDYIKLDKKGNCKLTEKLKEDFNICRDTINNYKKYIDEKNNVMIN